jgi:predicted nucleic-acid-binding protein
MRAVDTNVLVRLFTEDDTRGCLAAERFIAAGAWVPTLAVVETAWVLKRAYGLDGGALAELMEMLLHNEHLVLEDHDLVAGAVALFRERPTVGFSDCVMLVSARQAGHLPLGTFDRKLSRVEGTQLLSGGSRSA